MPKHLPKVSEITNRRRPLSLRELLAANGGKLPPLCGADPGDDDVTIDDVAQSVATLTAAVAEMRKGLVDKETVETIAAETLERQRAHARTQQRDGYKPEDNEDPEAVGEHLRAANPLQRMEQLHVRSARQTAPLVRATEDDIRNFQARADELTLISALRGVNPRDTEYFHQEYLPALRAVDTQTAGEGQEFVPRELSGSLIDRVSLELMVVALFPSIVMPTQPFDIPAKAVGRTRLGSAAENTADTGQTGFKKITPGSRKVTLTAVKFAGEALMSKEAEEDSIIAMMPFIQDELVEFIAADQEDAVINGDTTGTHQDSDVTAADDPRKKWIGLRKAALAGAKTDAGNVALTTAALLANRKKMGKYGVRVAPLAHILSMAGYVELLSDNSVQTVDKYGPNATVLTGELGKAHGVPLIVSEYVRQDLNATGVYDGTTTTRTEAITVNKNGFVIGERRGVTVQILREVYAEDDQDAILASIRKAFTPRYPAATETIVAASYNVAS